MKQIKYFNTRIIRDNEVFLLAEDVAAALGYSDVKLFLSKHNDIINTTNAILPALVKENDFNSILLSNKDVLQHIGHIEITKVDTLRSHTEAIKSFYPLKYMLEGKVLEYRAADAGYKSVSEYLDKVELPKDYSEEKRKFVSRKDILHSLKEHRRKINELIDYEVLQQNGLVVQHYIHIKEGIPYEESFIVGKGIFFSLYDSDYAFDMLKVISGDLIIPTFDGYEEFKDTNYGHDLDKRDYSEYSTLENILHIISHKKVEDVGIDLLCCESAGISFYISQSEVIKLLNPNMYREIILIDGMADFDYNQYITETE